MSLIPFPNRPDASGNYIIGVPDMMDHEFKDIARRAPEPAHVLEFHRDDLLFKLVHITRQIPVKMLFRSDSLDPRPSL